MSTPSNSDTDEVLDDGFRALRQMPAAPAQPGALWRRVEPHLWDAPPQRRAFTVPSWARGAAAFASLAAVVTGAALWHPPASLAPVETATLPWALRDTAGTNSAKTRWVDDPAAKSDSELWSALHTAEGRTGAK